MSGVEVFHSPMSVVRVTHSPMSRVMALYTISSGVWVSQSAMRGLGVTCSPVISVGVILLIFFNEYCSKEQGTLYMFLGIQLVRFCRKRSSRCCDISGSKLRGNKLLRYPALWDYEGIL